MTPSIKAFYSSIILTEEEKEEALLEGKKKKYFREKHKDYWNGKEGISENKKDEKVDKTGQD